MIVKKTLTNRHSKTYLCGIHVIFDLEKRRKQQMQGKLSMPAPTPGLKSVFNSSPTGEESKDFSQFSHRSDSRRILPTPQPFGFLHRFIFKIPLLETKAVALCHDPSS